MEQIRNREAKNKEVVKWSCCATCSVSGGVSTERVWLKRQKNVAVWRKNNGKRLYVFWTSAVCTVRYTHVQYVNFSTTFSITTSTICIYTLISWRYTSFSNYDATYSSVVYCWNLLRFLTKKYWKKKKKTSGTNIFCSIFFKFKTAVYCVGENDSWKGL